MFSNVRKLQSFSWSLDEKEQASQCFLFEAMSVNASFKGILSSTEIGPYRSEKLKNRTNKSENTILLMKDLVADCLMTYDEYAWMAWDSLLRVYHPGWQFCIQLRGWQAERQRAKKCLNGINAETHVMNHWK